MIAKDIEKNIKTVEKENRTWKKIFETIFKCFSCESK